MTAAAQPQSLRPFLPPRLDRAALDMGVYGVEFLPLTATAVRQTAFFKVEEDHAFLITHAAVFKTLDDAAVAQNLLATVNMFRKGSQGAIQQVTRPTSADTPLDCWFGSGQQPCAWQYPVILAPNDTLMVQLTNLEGAARNYRLTFLGCRIYRARAADPFGFCRNGW